MVRAQTANRRSRRVSVYEDRRKENRHELVDDREDREVATLRGRTGSGEVENFQARFKGTHDDYTVTMNGNEFTCNCHFFETTGEGTCCHVMALQRMLAPMLSEEQQQAGAPFSFATA
jgi:hypothetical protein